MPPNWPAANPRRRAASATSTHETSDRTFTESLEPRLLLTQSTDATIEKFNLSPALFVENLGQWTDESVRFVHQGRGASIAMTDRGPVFELYRGTGFQPVIDPKDQMDFERDHAQDAHATESTRFSVSFQNSNITQPIGHDRSTSTFNYSIGTPDLHRSNVHGFEKIVYPDLYEGIDLHTWGQRDSLKYEFHVDPNIDYRQIKVQYEGVEDLWIDDDGRLHAELGDGFGEVIDDSPVIWQLVLGKRVEVAGKFKLLDGDAGGDAYTFELTGKFDPKLPLVIDPDLAWSSYLGGTNNDNSNGVAIDSFGNIFVTGRTGSVGWTGAGFDITFNGGVDAFVVKLSPSGEHIWSTYLGGANSDVSYDISVDSTGNAYITGDTTSSGWVSGGFDTSYNFGTGDAFVVKLSASGQHVWSTYLGGTNGDDGNSVVNDSAGNVFIVGDTNSSTWINGGFDTSHNGANDPFVVKLSPTGAHIWSTYLSGTSHDYGNGIHVDTAETVYVAGITHSSDWVSGGFDTSFNGGSDAFVVALSTSGAHLWSTYLGGTGADDAQKIAADSVGNIYLTGLTRSSGWVNGGFDTSQNGGADAFVVKLSSSSTPLWSTYLGGAGDEYTLDIALDSAENIYVTGETASSGWVSGGFDSSLDGDTEAFVAKVSSTGEHLWSTYLGGADDDKGTGIASDSAQNVFVTGETRSADWVSGGFDISFNGGSFDGFIAKITDQADITIPIFENSTFNYLTTSEQTLTATFNENISASLAASDFVLTNLNTTTNIPLTIQSISADGQSATFTFSATGNDLGEAILTDGHYRIRALAGQIEDAAGNALAEYVDHFFDFKNADVANADQVVDFSDLLAVAQNYGMTSATFADGDVNYDGEVNFNDLLAVAQRYGTGIPELRIGRFIPTPTKSNRIIGDVFGSEARIL